MLAALQLITMLSLAQITHVSHIITVLTVEVQAVYQTTISTNSIWKFSQLPTKLGFI
jgi:hypothetical protein